MESENILDKINLLMTIWKEKNGEFICNYSNKNIKENYNIEKFIAENNDHDLKESYKQIINNEKNETINKYTNKTIIIKKIDDLIIEITYPIENNINLLCIISKKTRTPLTNIIGVLSLIENMDFNEKQKKLLNVFIESSYQIIDIVNDIVDIINLMKGDVVLDLQKTDIKNIIKNVNTQLKNAIKKNNNKLNVTFVDNVPQIVYVDNIRLQQILNNLITNANNSTMDGVISLKIDKFTKKTHKKYKCPFEFKKKHKYGLLFIIKDTGCGINDNTKKLINSIIHMKSNNENTYINEGFGLVISTLLCKLMNGHIWYKSEKDIGSIFYFNISCN